MDWYYKAGLAIGLIWATARVLGAYGESARELDVNFLLGFLLTTGGWGALFLVIDRVAKFLGWKRETRNPDAAPVATVETASARPVPTRSSRRKRR